MLTDSDKPKAVETVHQELPSDHPDPLFRVLHKIIRTAVRVLAVIMVFVIIWGIGDVLYVIYERLTTPPVFLLNINDIFYSFGAFMAVLIAVEIFINIRLYLGSNVFPVRLVVATALMAISRKVIILDVEKLSAMYIFAIAATTLALGITYWLIERQEPGRD